GEVLKGGPGWVWVHCEAFVEIPPIPTWLQTQIWPCGHSSAMAIAPLAIRWGLDASIETLPRCARCTRCGRKGRAKLTRPSWINTIIEVQPFPVDQMAPVI